MKTSQDWSFITRKSDLVKPRLQENKIFHALTAAYESNQSGEVYGATEAIVKREKELCEMALAELKKLQSNKEDPDQTLSLIIEHYQQRLEIAREKESRINSLSEDTRKMMEEYRQKNRELAEVKRNLMESQSKLRALAKETERLIKKEEELRFIESNLRGEIEKNQRDILNGLYEIVSDLPDNSILAGSPEAGKAEVPSQVAPLAASLPLPAPLAESAAEDTHKIDGIAEKATPFNAPPQNGRPLVEIPSPLAPAPTATVWYRDEATAGQPARIQEKKPGVEALLESIGTMERLEPDRDVCAKSFVKTAGGDIIAEYFYLPGSPKASRHYVFNGLHTVKSLLQLLHKDENEFHARAELIFGDLLSRLQSMQNIHLEESFGRFLSQQTVLDLLARNRKEKTLRFLAICREVLDACDALGSQRQARLVEQLGSCTA